jgi:hypothetical protein
MRRWIKRGLWTVGLLFALGGLMLLYADAYWDEVEPYIEDFKNAPITAWVSSSCDRYRADQLKLSSERFGQKLPAIDEVRLIRFARERSRSSQRKLKVPLTEKSDGYVVSEKQIVGTEAQRLATLWRSLTFTENHTMCFDPHHVVEFRSKGAVICEAFVCFHCMNSSLPAFPGPVLVNTFDMRQLNEGKSPSEGIYKDFKTMIEAAVGAAP